MSTTSVLACGLLLNLLKTFPYSSLRILEISFKGHAISITNTWTVKEWWKLDDALSSPNYAQLERIEFVGAFEMMTLVSHYLPQMQARKIIHFLT
jgi:hypothetical protein